jgi:hypothetical protein
MDTSLFPEEFFTREWLTRQLREVGEVLGIRQRANAAFNSQIAHLELLYDSAASASAPRQVLPKVNLPEPWAVTIIGLPGMERHNSMISVLSCRS